MENENVYFQLVPEHIHWRNAEEQAIVTQKNDFLDGLSSIGDGFPMHLLDGLI